MRTLRFVSALAVAFLLIAAPVAAQEGHPVKGSWLGTWGLGPDHLNDVIVILDWDGENITGIINPGTDNIVIENATLNPDGWVLSFEVETENQAGTTLNYEIEGTLDNLAFHDRTFTGTWTHDSGSGPFEIQRQ
jgi:hypothetical protein